MLSTINFKFLHWFNKNFLELLHAQLCSRHWSYRGEQETSSNLHYRQDNQHKTTNKDVTLYSQRCYKYNDVECRVWCQWSGQSDLPEKVVFGHQGWEGGSHAERKGESLPGRGKSADRGLGTGVGRVDVRNWKKASVVQREEGAVEGEIQEADGARSCRAWRWGERV